MRKHAYSNIMMPLLLILLLAPIVWSQNRITIWYGNPDGAPVEAEIGQRIYLDVWMVTDENVLGAGTLISIEANNYYIDSLINQSEAELYYPFSEWSETYFLDPYEDPFDPINWTGQSFVGCPFSGEPLIHFDTPTRVMTMVFTSFNDSSIAGDLAYCFGQGNHPMLGQTAISDTGGYYLYDISENYSPVQFDEVIGIDERTGHLPDKFSLYQNYPNPFNTSTLIKYNLPTQAQVSLDIYDILGRKIATLKDGLQQAGYHQIEWDAADVSSGVYFYKLTAGDYSETRRMMLVK